MVRVLFVCLGNICRSPLGEGVFRHLVEKRGLGDKFEVDSAGTAAYHIGKSPDHRSQAVAEENGITLVHQGRQFVTQDFEDFDYILAMDAQNLRDIQSLERFGSNQRYDLRLMREFDADDKGADVPDPYYGGIDGFQKVYEMLARSSESLLDHIIADVEAKPNSQDSY